MKKFLLGIGVLMILTACNAKGDEEEVQNNINKGLEAVAEDDFSKAEALFEIVLEANSEEANAKAYLEQVVLIQEAEDAKAENKLEDALKALDKAIDKKNGSKVISSKAKQQKEEIVALQEQEKQEQAKAEEAKKANEQVATTNKAVEKQTTVSMKNEYIQKLNNIEAGLSDIDYLYQNGITSEMLEGESITYDRWDRALNEIYAVLKAQLSVNEMNALKQQQRQWISTRDNTASAEASEFAGGTMESVQYVNTQARLTKERCYELVYNYMK